MKIQVGKIPSSALSSRCTHCSKYSSTDTSHVLEAGEININTICLTPSHAFKNRSKSSIFLAIDLSEQEGVLDEGWPDGGLEAKSIIHTSLCTDILLCTSCRALDAVMLLEDAATVTFIRYSASEYGGKLEEISTKDDLQSSHDSVALSSFLRQRIETLTLLEYSYNSYLPQGYLDSS